MAGQPTPEAKQDYNALLGALMPFAEQMLKKHGEFFPFGAAVSTTGEVGAHATYDGNEMHHQRRSSHHWCRRFRAKLAAVRYEPRAFVMMVVLSKMARRWMQSLSVW